MSIRDEFSFKTPEFQSYLHEDIAVIKIKCNVFETITDLAESGKLLSLIQLAERIPDVKALVVLNEPGCMDEEEYDKFLHRILDRGRDPYADDEGGGMIQKVDRVREINVLNRTITHLVEFKKISVMGLQGNIVTPFFGASLSVDFRYAAEGMSFSLAHLKYGLHPTGALPFFLPRYVSHSKAIEILFKYEKITAKEALDLGLVTTILPAADFENHCLAEIEKLCHLDTRVIHSTKLLANFSRIELRNYFDVESALLH
ncbi:MAG: enoyl-CoA hydratase/isomerase family protein [Candidatus Aminicenantes bacterium]|nr:MAG: enoyl-CoA hydratase/isomerase family protein [Candidatus Aminicenantes bacterium]